VVTGCRIGGVRAGEKTFVWFTVWMVF